MADSRQAPVASPLPSTRAAPSQAGHKSREIEGKQGDNVLVALLDGLSTRITTHALMRRPPMDCSPDEQLELLHLLQVLSQTRQNRAVLAQTALPALTLDDVREVWPALATMLDAAGQNGASADVAAEPVLADQPTARRAPRRGRITEAEPVQTTPAVEQPADQGPQAPLSPSPAAPVTAPAAAPTTQDLAIMLRDILRTDTRPWSASRIYEHLNQLQPQVTRQDVYDTLYTHGRLFRKTGNGWELVSGSR